MIPIMRSQLNLGFEIGAGGFGGDIPCMKPCYIHNTTGIRLAATHFYLLPLTWSQKRLFLDELLFEAVHKLF